jgi:hypothetical protein
LLAARRQTVESRSQVGWSEEERGGEIDFEVDDESELSLAVIAHLAASSCIIIIITVQPVSKGM